MKTLISILLSIAFCSTLAQDTTKIKSKKVDLQKSLALKPTGINVLYQVITMGKYTAAEIVLPKNLQSYGWINFGDGTGRQEIYTKQDYLDKWSKYMDK